MYTLGDSSLLCLNNKFIPKSVGFYPRFQRVSKLSNRRSPCRIIFCKAQPQDSVSFRTSGRNTQKAGDQTGQTEAQRPLASENGSVTTAVHENPVSLPSSPNYLRSPLLLVGVGVGISIIFSWVAKNAKRYAMQQFFKTMMGSSGLGMNQTGSVPVSPPSGFPFPAFTPPPENSLHSSAKVDTSKVERTDKVDSSTVQRTDKVDASTVERPDKASENAAPESKAEAKKSAFVDVSPEEVLKQKAYVDSLEDSKQTDPPKGFEAGNSDGQATTEEPQYSGSNMGPSLTVDTIEKMMEDPVVQKMLYQYLPPEMQNPSTFKWMMQNPQYRKQLEDMLNNVSGDGAWNKQMMDSLKNFDLKSQEAQQQFAQIGLTPEEVFSKIMANPEVAMAFQNPRVQAAIMDCSQNPMSITKYQNDKEHAKKA
eukprot:TRINITY_DN4903_c0_g1_i1.p1 TRINITY_DN4903_c0_g1~~TRINITY_DN4903_c0_g1_i1.p1  ORF type:complete len:422 (-),score=107.80 TRINITY_DN4903_c0_g1_i1:179-1444(-)